MGAHRRQDAEAPMRRPVNMFMGARMIIDDNELAPPRGDFYPDREAAYLNLPAGFKSVMLRRAPDAVPNIQRVFVQSGTYCRQDVHDIVWSPPVRLMPGVVRVTNDGVMRMNVDGIDFQSIGIYGLFAELIGVRNMYPVKRLIWLDE